MNIVEALRLAKEDGKKVRPKCWNTRVRGCWVVYHPIGNDPRPFHMASDRGLFAFAEFRWEEELLGEWEEVT